MAMHTNARTIKSATVFALLGGAVIGAIVMALTTPKTGREVRSTLRNSARRLRGKVEDTDELDTGTMEALFI